MTLDGRPGPVHDNRFFLIQKTPNGPLDTTITYCGFSASTRGREIYNVPGLGIVFGGREHRISTPANVSLIYTIDENGEKKRYTYSNILMDQFAPLKDGKFVILESYIPNRLRLWKLELPGIWSLGTKVPINSNNYDRIFGTKIIERNEGGFAGLATLYLDSNRENTSSLFFLTDANGSIVYHEIFGQPETVDVLNSLIQTRDGGYAIVGGQNGNPVLIKTDSTGNWKL